MKTTKYTTYAGLALTLTMDTEDKEILASAFTLNGKALTTPAVTVTVTEGPRKPHVITFKGESRKADAAAEFARLDELASWSSLSVTAAGSLVQDVGNMQALKADAATDEYAYA